MYVDWVLCLRRCPLAVADNLPCRFAVHLPQQRTKRWNSSPNPKQLLTSHLISTVHRSTKLHLLLRLPRLFPPLFNLRHCLLLLSHLHPSYRITFRLVIKVGRHWKLHRLCFDVCAVRTDCGIVVVSFEVVVEQPDDYRDGEFRSFLFSFLPSLSLSWSTR